MRGSLVAEITTFAVSVSVALVVGAEPVAFCTDQGDYEQVCFSPPAAEWSWAWHESESAYLASPQRVTDAIHVVFPGIKVLTSQAIRAQLSRAFFGQPDPTGNLVVTESSVPVPHSFRFISEAKPGNPPTVVGYVMPSGWVAFEILQAGRDAATLEQFVRTYRLRKKAA